MTAGDLACRRDLVHRTGLAARGFKARPQGESKTVLALADEVIQ